MRTRLSIQSRHPRARGPIGPTLYRAATDVLDRLLPEPVQVATWLRPIAHGDYPTGTTTPGNPILSHDHEVAVMSRLRRHLLRSAQTSYGADDQPLTQPEADEQRPGGTEPTIGARSALVAGAADSGGHPLRGTSGLVHN